MLRSVPRYKNEHCAHWKPRKSYFKKYNPKDIGCTGHEIPTISHYMFLIEKVILAHVQFFSTPS